MQADTRDPAKFRKIRVTELKKLGHISYWQYLSLQECKLKALYPFGVTLSPISDSFDFSSRKMLLGKVFHKMVEAISLKLKNGEVISSTLIKIVSNQVLKEIEKKSKSDRFYLRVQNLSSWPEIGILIKALEVSTSLWERKKSTSGNSKALFLAEKKLWSTDRKVVGKPDLIILGENQISIIDYKFGSINQAALEIVQKYEDQLQLYAIVAQDTFGDLPVRAFLIDKDGYKKEVAIDKNKGLELIYEMKTNLDNINRSIKEHNNNIEKVATPSSSSCSYCSVAPWCLAFRNRLNEVELPERNHIVFGWQESNIKTSRRAGSLLRVSPFLSSNSPSGGVISITRLNLDWFSGFQDVPGQPLIVSNFKSSSSSTSGAGIFETRIITLRE